jgi:hypothetical protein
MIIIDKNLRIVWKNTVMLNLLKTNTYYCMKLKCFQKVFCKKYHIQKFRLDRKRY